MKLTCPACGATTSADACTNDAAARETVAAIAALPTPLPVQMIGYLSLFRPAARGLSWKKAQRLVRELYDLVQTGEVRVSGSPSRPCPPAIWAAAMEEMHGRRDTIRRPLPNHNYLRKVAWQLADKADARAERETMHSGGLRSVPPAWAITDK